MKKCRGKQCCQETIRKLVVRYLRNKEGTQADAGIVFCLSKSVVSKIWVRYKRGGSNHLRSRKRGTRVGKKITGEQAEAIRRLIRKKLPDQLGLPFGLWTREAVAQLIAQKYSISLSRWQVGRYLKGWGYTPQKPIRKAFEQKPEKVKKWLEAEYPDIKKRATKEKAVIYFGDETGMRSDHGSTMLTNHQSGRSYTSTMLSNHSPKGQTPVIKATGKRFSLNMISAISNKGHLQFMIIEGSFNGDVFQTFLEGIIKYAKVKIFFITDGHPAHKTKKLQEWLAGKKDKIEVFYLPPYSPELNPQEYLNQDIKTNVIGKKRPINKEQMRSNVEKFMKWRKGNKKQVKKYFHEKHVKYAA
jgi:transposase